MGNEKTLARPNRSTIFGGVGLLFVVIFCMWVTWDMTPASSDTNPDDDSAADDDDDSAEIAPSEPKLKEGSKEWLKAEVTKVSEERRRFIIHDSIAENRFSCSDGSYFTSRARGYTVTGQKVDKRVVKHILSDWSYKSGAVGCRDSTLIHDPKKHGLKKALEMEYRVDGEWITGPQLLRRYNQARKELREISKGQWSTYGDKLKGLSDQLDDLEKRLKKEEAEALPACTHQVEGHPGFIWEDPHENYWICYEMVCPGGPNRYQSFSQGQWYDDCPDPGPLPPPPPDPTRPACTETIMPDQQGWSYVWDNQGTLRTCYERRCGEQTDRFQYYDGSAWHECPGIQDLPDR